MIHTYTELGANYFSLADHLKQLSLPFEFSYDPATKVLNVHTDANKSEVDALVASYSTDYLVIARHDKLKEFTDNTDTLMKRGAVYQDGFISASTESKSLYSSVVSDTSNGIEINYPLMVPKVSEGFFLVSDIDELKVLVTAINDRIIYVWGNQVNPDGSKGMARLAYEISIADAVALSHIQDTRE